MPQTVDKGISAGDDGEGAVIVGFREDGVAAMIGHELSIGIVEHLLQRDFIDCREKRVLLQDGHDAIGIVHLSLLVSHMRHLYYTTSV